MDSDYTRDKLILWFTILEAVDQLQSEGIEFKYSPDELMKKWGNDEAQSRVITDDTEDGEVYIKIEEER